MKTIIIPRKSSKKKYVKPMTARVIDKVSDRILLLIVILLAMFLNHVCFSQQHPIYTQYMFNGLVINPAYTGTHDYLSFTASMRSQWTGIHGAPQTEVFSVHTPINISRSSVGGVATHDRLGVTDQTMIYGTFSYRIPVSRTGKLSVGAQAGATYYKSDFSELNIISSDGNSDGSFAQNDARILPNLGIGAYFYTNKSYVGISLPTIIDNKWNRLDPQLQATQERHYFLTAGYVFDLSPDLKLKPNVLLKWVEKGPFQYDINANMLIKDAFWVGVSYRMRDSIDGLLQWNVNHQLSVGYSYGHPTSTLSSLQSGTHEVMVSYRINKDKHIVLNPRYF